MLAHKVAIGSLVLGAAQLASRFFDLIAMVVIARLLTPEDFGLVALAVSVMLVVNAVTDLPVADALVQKTHLEPGDVDAVFPLSIMRGCLVALVIIIVAEPVAMIFEDGRLTFMLAVLATGPLASGFASPMMIMFQRQVNYAPAAKVQLLGKSVAFAGSVTIAWVTHSYWALIAGLVAAPLVITFVSYVFAPYRPHLRLSGAFGLLSFTGWITASRLIWTLNMQADRFFIGGMLGKLQLGFYTLGSDFASTATYSLATPVTQTLFSGFSRISDNQERLRAAYLKGQQVIMACIMPIGVGLAVTATPLVDLVLGPKWHPVVPVIVWLAPAISLQMLTVAVHSISMATGNTRMLTIRELANLTIRLPPTIIGALWFGMIGAVIARAVFGLVVVWVNLLIAARLLKLPVIRQLSYCWRSVASVVLMGGVVLIIGEYLPASEATTGKIAYLALQVMCGALVYGAAHFTFWQAVGKPDGAETFVIDILSHAVAALKRVRPSAEN